MIALCTRYRKVFKHKTASLKLQKGKENEKNV